MTDEPGMVIVGAGECGVRAAFALRENGYKGPVTLIGAEQHLPYERPPLSKAGMPLAESLDAGSLLASPAPKAIAKAERFEEAGIRFLKGTEAVAIDRDRAEVRLGDGSTLPYAKLLLATGARPRPLPSADATGRALYLRTHDQALAIGARLRPGARIAVIGGGFIGLELAAAASERGCAVLVIESQPRILQRGVPAEIAAVIADAHEAHGVTLHCGQAITDITGNEQSARVLLADGSAIEADILIVGIGAVPNTELAESAGLAVENGIKTDAMMATSDPAIFAAGDCCSFPLAIYGGRRVRLEAWRSAQEQGALAARNMLGLAEPHAAVPWFWSDQFDLGLQIAGLSDEGRTSVRRDLGEGAFILFHLAEDGRLVAASGIGLGNAVARDIRLAEMMIAKGAKPDPGRLASPDTKLKSLLAA